MLVEAYAHQGKMKGSQPMKLAADALKLITLREALLPRARLVLDVADPVVADHVRRSWLGAALELWTVHLQVVELPEHVVAGLTRAQDRQRMVNPPAPPVPAEPARSRLADAPRGLEEAF